MSLAWEKRVGKELRRLEIVAVVLIALAAVLVVVTDQVARARMPQPVEDNLVVLAQANAMPNQGWAPLTVYFSAYGSAVQSGEIARYEWDLDGNGLFDTDATHTAGYSQYTYTKPGAYVVTLRVSDGENRYSTAQVIINVRHPASSSVNYGYVFDDSLVRRIDISLSQANWNLMWADVEAKTEVPADAVIFGEALEQVGFRMRGQFSLRESRDKKPWKINTDAYIDGQEFHNLKMLVLVNAIGDASFLQEKLAYDMMRFAGAPAGHMTFVELWIDISDDNAPGTFWGVYGMVERVDRKFVANRFGQDSKDGNLYKASHAQRGPMDLIYYGERIEDYPTQNGQYAYGKMTNEEQADYSDIITLCRALDGVTYTSEREFIQALEAEINVDSFLRYMAVIATLGNWDAYPFTGNNYYLYYDQTAGRFEWIPWDLSWGGDVRAPLFDLEGPRLVERAPMYDRLIEVDKYRLQLAAYVDLLMRYWFNEDHMGFEVRKFHQLIAPYVAQGDKLFYGPNALHPPSAFEEATEGLVRFVSERSAFIGEVLGE